MACVWRAKITTDLKGGNGYTSERPTAKNKLLQLCGNSRMRWRKLIAGPTRRFFFSFICGRMRRTFAMDIIREAPASGLKHHGVRAPKTSCDVLDDLRIGQAMAKGFIGCRANHISV